MTNLDKRADGGVYVIAEMSGNHGGRLDRALEIVRAAADAGADCLKVQTYTADTITIDCRKDCFVIRGGLWDGRNLHDLYDEAHTPWEWHAPIKEECEALGLDFLSTPFDFTSADFLEELGVGSFKIASPELIDIPLIRYVAAKGKPMLVSTGMGAEDEVREAVEAIRSEGNDDITLLQCCSQYPADYSNMNLSLLSDMGSRFGCRTGLSDHSPGSLGPVCAVALGASVVEKHLCLDRSDGGSDSAFSMEPAEFAKMVVDVRDAERALGQPVYGPSEGELRGLRNRRSLFAVKDIREGEAFTPDNVRSIRPGQGLAPKHYYKVLGKRASCDIEFGTPLSWELVER